MSVLKYYNPTTEQWESILAGKQGPQGPSGVVTTTAPITNSGTSSAANIGLDYISLQYGQNAIMNGAFEINQRNFTSTTTNGTYLADRWRLRSNDVLTTASIVSFGSSGGPNPQIPAINFLRAQTSGQTGSSTLSAIRQLVEDARVFAGQTVTFSFYAKSLNPGALLAFEFKQVFGTGGSGISTVFGTPLEITTSWARYSLTVTLPAVSDKTIGTDSYLEVSTYVSVGSDYSSVPLLSQIGIQSNTFDFWGFQLEEGSVATPFKRHSPNIQAELAACQRYYVRFENTGAFAFYGIGRSFSTSNYDVFVTLPVPMRVRPTSLDFSNLALTDTFNNSLAAGSPVISAGQSSNRMISVSSAPSGLTAGRTVFLINNNNVNGFLGFNAEF
jgi:hypothetical protein